jgi:hypothetical protein
MFDVRGRHAKGLPGTTMTSGSFPLRLHLSEAGRNSLPSIASLGRSAGLLMTWK